MGALITTDPATLAVTAPDGTPVTADMASGAPITTTVTANQVSITGAVGRIVTRVMAGEGAYFDGDTARTAYFYYQWSDTPHASSSTEWQDQSLPGQIGNATQWDETACLGPPQDYGRWNDQPASLRWSQLDPTATWDSYLGG